jgi:hypothetical protein
MTPKRIQRKRMRGWRLPPNTKCVDRSTKYGNNFKIGEPDFIEPNRPMTAEDAVKYFEWSLSYMPQEMIDEWKAELAGHDLACWCPEDAEYCHADVLLRLANS